MKQEDFEKLTGIKLPKGASYVDMDRTKLVEPTTAGWTDSQIRNKKLSEFDAMIRSCTLSIESLEKALQGEVARKQDLLRLRNRRVELGD